MNTFLRRGALLALALLTLVMGVLVPARQAKAAMYFNNTISASVSASVNSSGKMTTYMSVSGISGVTTRIGVELRIQYQIYGIFWKTVDIGYTDNVWIDSTTSIAYSNTFDFNLSISGNYRARVTYTVSGTGGADDVITKNSNTIL